MTEVHPVVAAVTARIAERSLPRRTAYLELMARQRDHGVNRHALSCGNLAHASAASGDDKSVIQRGRAPNIAIVTAYNDMLSAHQPYGPYPAVIKIAAREIGATAQVAGGVPAMCDGVTQGQSGMELSLFSRDVIAMSTAVSLSHAMFDGVLMLGICDKIVPGLLIGALRFGHLPVILVPGGPMPSGLPNKEKARVRQLFAEGKVDRARLLEAEAASYHAPGTCTFYGTANSNQMMMEVMGLHMPGAAFVNTNTRLRAELTRAATHRVAAIGNKGDEYRPLCACIDEKAIVNAAVGLMATGGSTNHTIHLPAIARAAGIIIDWEDLDRLSAVVPLLARIYPSGSSDINDFQSAGGMAFVIGELIEAGLLHRDLVTVARNDLNGYAEVPGLVNDALSYATTPKQSLNPSVLRGANDPFSKDGGMRLLTGNLGRAIIKTSAVEAMQLTVEAPAAIFNDQDDVLRAFKAGELDRDVVIVVRFQGPRANGMPELHKLTPSLGVLQDRGFRVALVTDGRMSGASGKVPAAIHATPEAYGGGPLARLNDGDILRVCAVEGELFVLLPELEWAAREPISMTDAMQGTGRELFALLRDHCDGAEQGASAMLVAARL